MRIPGSSSGVTEARSWLMPPLECGGVNAQLAHAAVPAAGVTGDGHAGLPPSRVSITAPWRVTALVSMWARISA
jgi:hypothetical protein